MTRLNQLLAIFKDVKSGALRTFTDLHRESQKSVLYAGLSRTYQPKDEDGDELPSESTLVQVRADAVLSVAATTLSRLFDVIATVDRTNADAVANIVVNGQLIAADVPATTLIALEKQLVDLGTFVGKLPTLDPAETWVWDNGRNCWASEPAKTARSKKIPRNHVKAPATQHHPAQVELYYEDVLVGYWTTTKLSGALPAARIAELQGRIAALREAVKRAREEANMVTVVDKKIGSPIFEYLFA